MDRLKNSYHYNGAFYTWNRKSARLHKPQYWDAPHYEQYQNTNKNKNSTYSGNFGLNYDIIEGLSANVEVKRRQYNRTNWGRTYVGVNTLQTQAGYSEGSYVTENNEVIAKLSYEKRVTDDFDVSAILGYGAGQNKTISTSASTSGGLAIPDFYTVANSKDKPNYGSSKYNNSRISAYGLISLGWNSMIYLDLSLIHI